MKRTREPNQPQSYEEPGRIIQRETDPVKIAIRTALSQGKSLFIV